jgi:hypothetical protein
MIQNPPPLEIMLSVDPYRGDLDGLKVFITAAGKNMFTFMSVR